MHFRVNFKNVSVTHMQLELCSWSALGKGEEGMKWWIFLQLISVNYNTRWIDYRTVLLAELRFQFFLKKHAAVLICFLLSKLALMQWNLNVITDVNLIYRCLTLQIHHHTLPTPLLLLQGCSWSTGLSAVGSCKLPDHRTPALQPLDLHYNTQDLAENTQLTWNGLISML